MTVHGLSQEPLVKLRSLIYIGRLKIKTTWHGGSIGVILNNIEVAKMLQKMLSSQEAAKILQKELGRIDDIRNE